MYNGSTWTQTNIFGPDDIIDWMGFGFALSVEDDELIVGSYGDDHALTDAGSFYHYKLDGNTVWTNIVSGEANDSTYAWTPPVSGHTNYTLRVTATDLAGNSVYDYSDTTFAVRVPTPELTIVQPDNEASWDAGETHAITWIATDSVSGIADLDLAYSTDTLVWSELQKFQANELEASDSFGASVSIDGNRALVGAT